MLKKLCVFGIVALLILSVNSYCFAATDSQLSIELDSIKIPAYAQIDVGNIYLPLRAIGEALGYSIEWSGKDCIVTVSKPGKNIVVDLKNYKMTSNDHAYYMSGDDNGMIVGSRTYMGTDFFSDNFGLKVRWDKQGGKVMLDSVKENSISIKTIKEASEDDNIKITLQYPQIYGLEDKAVQNRINLIFKKSADAARAEGLKYAEDRAKGNDGSPNKYETYFDYRLKYNQNGLLSLIFDNYQYTGGAHGLTVQSSYTFDLKTGEEYNIGDLFKGGSNYTSLINNAVKEEMNERVKEGILPEEPLVKFESIKTNQDFYLSNDSVVVYFQQYEYFPYAAGIQAFKIEFSTLKDVLKQVP